MGFLRKAYFLLILLVFLSLHYSQSLENNHQLKPLIEGRVFNGFKGKNPEGERPKETDKMLQFVSGDHVLGFRKGDMFIASGVYALRIEFVNARPVSPADEGVSLDTENNRQDVKLLGRVSYRDLWDGVTLVYEKHNTGVVKSTYTVQPRSFGGASPVDRIRLRYNVPVAVDDRGNLIFPFETGQMKESRPVAWQKIEGKHIPVEVSFRALGEREAGLKVGPYDPRFSLVIDPVLSWHTFMGSASEDRGECIAVDTSGNVYVAGYSSATWGAPVNAHAGGIDAFVAKLNSNGVRQWHTFMGSASTDYGRSIAVDTSGNVYVAGNSYATWGTPINPYAGDYDAFAAKLNSSGVRQWHTFMGSANTDWGCYSIAVDGSTNVYLLGMSDATWGSPINAHAGGRDTFTAKLNSSGIRQWHTFMGGSNDDDGYALAVDTSGNVYVAGTSIATWGTPINPYSGAADAFVAKMDSSGIRQWHTFMGSSSDESGLAVAVDTSGNIYVAGYCEATWGTPINPHSGNSDAFISKLNSSGLLQWHTFMGGFGWDYSHALAIEGNGNIYVAGSSSSAWGTPIDPYSGNGDTFVAKLNSSGVFQWHTFMGSSSYDGGNAIALDGSGNVYVAGYSYATWGTPINPYTGDYDAFVAKVSTYNLPPLVFGGHDFDGNSSSDIAVFRPTNGMWYIKEGASQQWGAPGDIPVQGYYDLNLTTDIAIWRPSNGIWYISGISTTQWGASGDIPVPHDYSGDTVTDIAVWRPSNGVWYINGVGDYQWGQDGDYPVPGDYNGDGVDEVAVWRPTEGAWYISGIGYYQWGSQGDIPVPADYNGDGKTDLAVFRPVIGMWYIQYMGGGTASVQWGMMGDVPVPGDYDGNGTTEVAIWRPSDGLWYIYGNGTYQWGQSGDIPLVR